ncbi:MAG: hypothetical protein NVV66_18565 [Cellulomonas sp.]|uniref:hypothetical protein n=1 Tax=Cellulomonas sp. TaxID=40001 RepID=UPI002582B172|nr:hypothetical protein [Cellulomonas sp.]MCR6706599.1 hypothetical protein [Cellulomonas sp.]
MTGDDKVARLLDDLATMADSDAAHIVDLGEDAYLADDAMGDCCATRASASSSRCRPWWSSP